MEWNQFQRLFTPEEKDRIGTWAVQESQKRKRGEPTQADLERLQKLLVRSAAQVASASGNPEAVAAVVDAAGVLGD